MCDSAAVVGGGFWVDEEAGDLWGFKLEGVLQGGDGLVDLGHGEGVREGAVAVDLDAVMVAGDVDVMDVEDIREGAGNLAEGLLEKPVTLDSFWPLDGGRFGLDVGEDGGDAGDFPADI